MVYISSNEYFGFVLEGIYGKKTEIKLETLGVGAKSWTGDGSIHIATEVALSEKELPQFSFGFDFGAAFDLRLKFGVVTTIDEVVRTKSPIPTPKDLVRQGEDYWYLRFTRITAAPYSEEVSSWNCHMNPSSACVYIVDNNDPNRKLRDALNQKFNIRKGSGLTEMLSAVGDFYKRLK
ncbi:hypothetical protein J4467_02545 [Candidatus Woesearchaeota archaeon]|nr:hypothetical protein [Candidatus Woesearchaeota archaeon]